MVRRRSEVRADAFGAFVVLGRNWRSFLGLLVVMGAMALVVVGLPEEFHGAEGVLFTLILAMGWLATIYMLRQDLAGEEVLLRDGLFKSMAPLLTTLLMLGVVTLMCVPVMVTVVAWASAMETHFVDMPFNALMLILFSGAMAWLSGYLLSFGLMALTAVSAPGMYPVAALLMAHTLTAKKRVRVIFKVILLAVVAGAMGAIVVVPLVMLGARDTVVVAGAMGAGCIMTIYVATYLYLYYKELLG